jgi:MarR family transcriptional regulator, transcriptional regulator for hemolysin
MRALNVYTHYSLNILNIWKALGRHESAKLTKKPTKKTTQETTQETDRKALRSMSLDLKRRLIAQLVESSRLLRNYIDHRAKERGTTRAQWIVLFRLRQQEGLSQVDLADVLELQPISLVRLLDRLVEHGLLERRPHPKDRRANRLFLTQSGRQLVDDLDSLGDAIATDVLRDVPAGALQTSLDTLVEVKERLKSLSESPDIAVK